MKASVYILGGLLLSASFGLHAQESNPDQNPRHEESAAKYEVISDELTSTQSTTVQDTYEAYDYREAKEAEKQERQDRRYELKKLRYQSRNRCCPNNGFNNGYNNNGFNNNGYYNNGGCNNNYNGYNNWNYGAGVGLGLNYIIF